MTHARFDGVAYDPDQALKMIQAFDAASAELQAAGDDFDPEALAAAIIVLERTPQTDAANLARRAVAWIREGPTRSA